MRGAWNVCVCGLASGGVVSIQEIEKLNDLGLYGAIVGKAIYEGNIPLKELERFILQTN